MIQNKMDTTNLYTLINQHDVISFDIFDTILCRFVSGPKDLFEVMAVEFVKQFPQREYSPKMFKYLRRKAEREARKKTDEVTLLDIYAKLPWSEEEKVFAYDLELRLEGQYTYLNPDMSKVLQYCVQQQKTIILISDMYLTKMQIEALLVQSGFDLTIVKKLFVSSEYGYSKDQGKLFDIVKDELSVTTFLHIGDNYKADYISAKQKGLTAFHYDKFTKENELIFDMEKSLVESNVVEIESLRKVLRKTGETLEIASYNLGAQILGPVYTLFAEWIIDYCLKNNLSFIRPLMREGYLFTEVLRKVTHQRQVSIEVEPIYISRKAAYLFDKEQIDEHEIKNLLWKQHFQVKNVFDLLGLRQYPDFITNELHSHVEDLENKVYGDSTIDLKTRLFEFLTSTETLSCIRKAALTQKEYFKQYIRQTSKERPFATVDLGYDGTIQTQMEHVLHEQNMHHLLLVAGDQVKGKLFKGMNIYSFLGSTEDEPVVAKRIKKGAQVLESMTNVAKGSTENYRIVQDVVEPVLEDISFTDEHIVLQEQCWKGIYDFQEGWFDITEQNAFIKPRLFENKKGLLSILYRLLTNPLFEEANVISRLIQNESYKFTKVNPVIKQPDLQLLDELGTEKFIEVTKKVYFPYEVVWPEGVIALNQPTYYTNMHFKKSLRQFEDLTAIFDTLSSANLDEHSNVYIYGAGEMGEKVSKVLNLLTLDYQGFIDRNANNMNNQFLNKRCVTLDDFSVNDSVIVIASFAFKNQIMKDIQHKFENKVCPRIISFEL